MSSTSISNLPAEVPESVRKAVEAFGQGDLSLPDVRQTVSRELEANPVVAEPIHQFLDEALRQRTLSIADYGELVSAVGAVVSENIPTEWSDDAHEGTGVFRVVEEGTLVPTNLEEWPEFKALAAKETAEEQQNTQPYGLEVVNEADAGPAAANEDDPGEPDVGRTTIVSAGPGTVLRERFRLEEEVARGAMGVVYRATDLMKLEAGAADPQVAIKLISPDIAGDNNALRAFQNEFSSTQHLSHPNIIRVFELDRDADQYFITMEWLEGQSLASLLDSSQGSALQPTQTYAIIEQLCDALIYAHEHKVVHADVKPGNVFLLASGEVKLIDFGIARCEGDLADQTSDKSGDAVALTPAYASCERLEQQNPAPQDDLYSLASLIYRLLAGRRVFGPLTALEAEQQDAEAVRIGSMDDRRWDALSRALSFRANDRQDSVSQFVDEFGRRSQMREEFDDGDAEQDFGDTTQLPLSEAIAADATEFDLPDNMEVDFPLDETAAEAAEPELSAIFDAAALSGDSEEIVLSSEPKPPPQPIDYPPVAEAPRKKTGVSIARLPKVSLEPVLARLNDLSTTQKQAAGGVLAAAILVAVLVSWLGGEDEAVRPRTVTMPQLATPAPQPEQPAVAPATELLSETAEEPAIDEPEAVTEPEATAVTEPEPEPAPEPEPQVAAVTEPEPEPEPEPAPEPEVAAVAEPEPEPSPVAEATVAAEPEPAAAAAAEPVDAAAEAEAVAEVTEAEQPQLLVATVPEASATVPAETELVGPMPVSVPPPPPESVALSDLEFIKYVEPRYPRSTIDRRYEGWVDVEFRVGADGLPLDIRVVESNLPAKFEGTSIAAVEKWRFEPYVHEGEAIAIDSAVRLRYAN